MNFNDLTLFNSLSHEQMQKLLHNSRQKQFQKDQILFYENDQPLSLFIVLEGHVNVYKCTEDGTEKILRTFGKGDMFAEMPCFNATPYPASAKAASDVNLLELECKVFKTALEEDAQIAMRIISSLSKKIISLEHYINSHLHMSATQKVVRYLLENPQSFFKKKNKEIAQELNMRVETFSRVLRKLKDAGAVDTKKQRIEKSLLISIV